MIKKLRGRTLGASSIALLAALTTHAPAFAQEATSRYAIPAQSLSSGLLALGRQGRLSIAAPTALVAGKTGRAVQGELTARAALAQILQDSGLGYEFVAPNAVRIVEAQRPQDEGAGGASPAQALAQPAVSELSEVVVTGTRIRGRAPAGSELVNLSRKDIEQIGRATVTDLVKTIPQIESLGATEGLNGHRGQGQIDDNSAATSVNLRGLGPDATLVLVNGRRVAPTAAGAFVDISQLPLSMIERVEVLPDGASAIYGSDAVGGVVNFVLRKGRQAPESDVRYGVGSGFHEYTVDQRLGFDWNSGSVLLGYEYYSRTHLAASKRDYYRSDLRAFGGPDYRDPRSSVPGNIFINGVFYAIPKGQDGTHLQPSDLVAGAPNLSDVLTGSDILPSQQRNSVVVSLTQDLTAHAKFYLDGLYSTRDFDKRRGAASTNLTVPNTNPFFVSPIPGLTSETVFYSFADDLPARLTGHSDNYTLTSGLKVDLPRDWVAEVSGTVGEDRESNTATGAPNQPRLDQALADPNPATAFNPFGDGSHTPAATLAKIAGSIRYRNIYDVRDISLGANGGLLPLPGGELRMAIGADYRTESLNSFSRIDQDQPTPYSLPSDGTTDRHILAGYVELAAPIVGEANARPGIEGLDLSLAVRTEHYSDFGNTTNPKLGFVWKPIHDLSLRGSWGASFKAPRLEQLNEGQNAWLFVPYFPNAAASPTSPSTPLPGYSTVLALVGLGNKNLRPETAHTWSVGADFQPSSLPGLKLGLTYFSISYKNRISAPTVEEVSAALAQGSVLNDRVLARDPTQAQVDAVYAKPTFQGLRLPANFIDAILSFQVSNFGAVEESGLDLAGSYQFDVPRGHVTLDGGLTYLTRYAVQEDNGQPFVGRLNTFSNPNRLHGRASLTWQDGPGQAGLAVNYIGAYRNDLSTLVPKVSDWVTLDAHLGYTLPNRTGLARGVTLLLDIENLLDRAPPFVDNEDSKIGYDPEQGNPRGRTVSLTLRKTW